MDAQNPRKITAGQAGRFLFLHGLPLSCADCRDEMTIRRLFMALLPRQHIGACVAGKNEKNMDLLTPQMKAVWGGSVCRECQHALHFLPPVMTTVRMRMSR